MLKKYLLPFKNIILETRDSIWLFKQHQSAQQKLKVKSLPRVGWPSSRPLFCVHIHRRMHTYMYNIYIHC